MNGRVFRDPVHGLIELKGPDVPISSILDTKAFQRLRRVKAMGFAREVYFGAEHSRFGHALGAFHIAGRVCQSLELNETVTRHVKVAALLHDIGHGPFSHTWEHAFPESDHEEWGRRIVLEDPELRGALEAFDPELPDVLDRFWRKTYTPAFARKLVSSELDVDRLDYLLRDGHYSGAGYATFDLDWILHALKLADVHEAPDSIDLVVDYRRGMYAVEQYLFARSYMYAQVYHHKTVRAVDQMFVGMMRRFRELVVSGNDPGHLAPAATLAVGDDLSVSDYLTLDDYGVIRAADEWAARKPDPVLADLADRLTRRRLFKTFDLGDDPTLIEDLRESVTAAATSLFGEHAKYYFAFDTAKQTGYSARTQTEELHVIGHPRYGTVSLGQLMEKLPIGHAKSTVRLVCAHELVEPCRPLVAATLR